RGGGPQPKSLPHLRPRRHAVSALRNAAGEARARRAHQRLLSALPAAVSGAAPTRETIVPKTMANLATPGRRGRGPWGDHVRSLARRPVARAGRNRPGAGARAPRGGGPRLRSLRRKRYGPPCGDGSALRPAGRCAADDAPGTP